MILLCGDCKRVLDFEEINIILEQEFGNAYSSKCICCNCLEVKDENSFYILEKAFPVQICKQYELKIKGLFKNSQSYIKELIKFNQKMQD